MAAPASRPPLPGLATHVRRARRRSMCGSCGRLVNVGNLIAKVGGRWIHLDCVEAVKAARPVATVRTGLL